MTPKALLFINGLPPKSLPSTEGYHWIACTDGAFNYLEQMNFPLQQLDFVSGDFDSHHGFSDLEMAVSFIETPDQEKTDFEKALEILLQKGCKSVAVYGGSGGEMDHFLGNLQVASKFRTVMDIRFFDEFSEYFLAPHLLVLEEVKGKMISLYPFPVARKIVTKGLNWELDGADMEITTNMGIRNFATDDQVTLQYESGSLIVFVGK